MLPLQLLCDHVAHPAQQQWTMHHQIGETLHCLCIPLVIVDAMWIGSGRREAEESDLIDGWYAVDGKGTEIGLDGLLFLLHLGRLLRCWVLEEQHLHFLPHTYLFLSTQRNIGSRAHDDDIARLG